MSAFGKTASNNGCMPPAQSSAKQNTSVNDGAPPGSGARPGSAKMMIETSAPNDAHTLDRAPPGWLK